MSKVVFMYTQTLQIHYRWNPLNNIWILKYYCILEDKIKELMEKKTTTVICDKLLDKKHTLERIYRTYMKYHENNKSYSMSRWIDQYKQVYWVLA